jgi:SAM-dependent methyltransferase
VDPDAYLEMAATETNHWWFIARRKILSSEIGQLKLPANANILEIGAGTGGNLKMLSAFGNVFALEKDNSARTIADKNTNHQFDIRAGSCPDQMTFNDVSFDLICMFDVLEHIEDDAGTLVALKGLLKKNGKVLITVPAFQWLWGYHDEFLHHQRRYTTRKLKMDINAAGLHTHKITYFNTLLFPLAAMARLKDKMTGSSQASGTSIPPTWINKTFMNVFTSERSLLRHMNFPFGVSILAIIKNRQEEKHVIEGH